MPTSNIDGSSWLRMDEYQVGKLYRFMIPREWTGRHLALMYPVAQRLLTNWVPEEPLAGMLQYQKPGFHYRRGEIGLLVQTIKVDFRLNDYRSPDIIDVPIFLFKEQLVVPSKILCYHHRYIEIVDMSS